MSAPPPGCFTHLECPECGATLPGDRLQTLCGCGSPLLARYDLDRARRTLTRADAATRPHGLWRWREVLPVADPANIFTLGEGGTPLRPAPRLGALLGLSRLLLKDECGNPTGSFKARGLSVALSRARELGATRVALPSAGNAASALTAYAARGGMTARVYLPRDVPALFPDECRAFGAEVVLVDGVITDCGRALAAVREKEGWFDVSTLKEPYRLEGKKTMGYELAQDLGWRLPANILYPTGGGTGLVGMWKAFAEMEQLGLVGRPFPRMVSVQAEGCAPMVQAFRSGAERATPVPDPFTVAAGLRVPAAVGDRLMLRALRESAGTAVAVSDDELLWGTLALARLEGIYPAPEAGAAVAAAWRLKQAGFLDEDSETVLFLTGSGYKYADVLAGLDARIPAGLEPPRA
ncbi:MAG: threonine synthase [Candidatus Eisenbacteria bacterium]|nr:threonine synthase [Candidatus Eisenbacteria bacterium]